MASSNDGGDVAGMFHGDKGFYSGPILGCLQDVLLVCFPIIVLVERVGRVLAVVVGILGVAACTRGFW